MELDIQQQNFLIQIALKVVEGTFQCAFARSLGSKTSFAKIDTAVLFPSTSVFFTVLVKLADSRKPCTIQKCEMSQETGAFSFFLFSCHLFLSSEFLVLSSEWW